MGLKTGFYGMLMGYSRNFKGNCVGSNWMFMVFFDSVVRFYGSF